MNALIECPECKTVLVEPVILPCGHTVCKKHEKEQLVYFRCSTCTVKHEYPEHGRGFTPNTLVQNLLDHKLDKADLGAEHRVAEGSYRELRKLVDDFKLMRDTPELKIKQVAGEMRNSIEARREQAKRTIDEEADELIAEIDKYETSRQATLACMKKQTLSSSSHDLVCQKPLDFQVISHYFINYY